MQPRHKNVRLHPTCEREKTDGDVRDLLMQIVPPLSSNLVRGLVQKSENDGNVVRRKRPKDVFFSSDFSQVQPIGVDVLDSAELSGGDEFFQLDHRGVIPEQMSDHKDKTGLLGQRHQLRAFFDRETERCFDEYVLSC